MSHTFKRVQEEFLKKWQQHEMDHKLCVLQGF